MTKQQSLEKIKKLVEKYENLSEAEKKGYNEQATKTHFIRPLFEALGWNFEEEVWPEESVSGKRVDWAFRINNIVHFFVEAKPFKVNLDEEKWAEQAIDYSWHKSVPWVILTDFEAIKVFNTEWDEPDIQSCQFIEIKYQDYLTDERLWWFSKEAFERGVLNQEADKLGRRPKTTIDKQLAEDLVRWRDFLCDTLDGWNPDMEAKKIADYVQRILDRLIFIRTLEDRGIEDKILQPIVREWEAKKGIKANELLFALNKTFRTIDSHYNSGLFHEDACDHLGEKLNADDNDFVEIIEELYKTKRKGIRYNFAAIPADVFGSIYEQYLGHIQKQDDKKDQKSKRKSQGIYYTPRYIVDYIVQNTLAEALKTKTPQEIKALKILDPACGSGSFLISAYQTLIDYWQKERDKKSKFKGLGEKLEGLEKAFKEKEEKELSAEEKQRILLNNIFGVDLDEEAAELAKLNLLLKMVGKRAKLPKLETNIQVGNSLISGAEKELKKYFGKNWKDKKPFNWSEKFDGGFDVVIGNPPYISFYSRQAQTSSTTKGEINYFRSKYKFITEKNKLGRFNTVMFFTERAIDLLKEGGSGGLIIDMNIFGNPYKDLRKYLLENAKILKIIVNLTDFEGVASGQVIVIFQKNRNLEQNNKNMISWMDSIDDQKKNLIRQGDWYDKANNFEFRRARENKMEKLFKKIENRGTLGELYPGKLVRTSITFTGQKDQFVVSPKDIHKYDRNKIYPLLEGSMGVKDRYCTPVYHNYVNYDEKLRDQLNQKYVELAKKTGKRTPMVIGLGSLNAFKEPKIFLRLSSKKITATYTEDILCADLSLYVITSKVADDKFEYNLKYTLAVLNSNLINFFAIENRLLKQEKGGMPQIRLKDLKKLPIPRIDFTNKKEKAQHDELVKLADKMLKLNQDLQKLDPIMDEKEYREKKKEIEKTDKEIDERVFELYGVGEEEVKAVEKNGY